MSDELQEEIRSLREALAGISVRLDALERTASGAAQPTVIPPPAPRAPAVLPVATVAQAPSVPAPPAIPRENLELQIGRY